MSLKKINQSQTIWHWNVNGLKTILKKNKLQEFIKTFRPSILCLNETKINDAEVQQIKDDLKSYFTEMHFACC